VAALAPGRGCGASLKSPVPGSSISPCTAGLAPRLADILRRDGPVRLLCCRGRPPCPGRFVAQPHRARCTSATAWCRGGRYPLPPAPCRRLDGDREFYYKRCRRQISTSPSRCRRAASASSPAIRAGRATLSGGVHPRPGRWHTWPGNGSIRRPAVTAGRRPARLESDPPLPVAYRRREQDQDLNASMMRFDVYSLGVRPVH